MSLAILDSNGIHFLFRWLHIFSGIVWIGHLYYFNFVQGAFFNETDAGTKSNAIQKLVPRALWWFRYGALWTILTGLVMVTMTAHDGGMEVFKTAYGVTILIGMTLGTLMFLNVWLIIWPKQKIVIENASLTAQGKPGLPEAAAAGARAGVASRTNTLFSIPMLFFMVGARHMALPVDSETYKFGLLAILCTIVIGGLELNAIKGKTGPMTSIKGVVICGFVLTVVLYAFTEICK